MKDKRLQEAELVIQVLLATDPSVFPYQHGMAHCLLCHAEIKKPEAEHNKACPYYLAKEYFKDHNDN